MDLLRELLYETLSESDSVASVRVSRKIAHLVYHRDYLKTKDRPYRKYRPERRKKRIHHVGKER